MSQQILISLGREFGSGGHRVAQAIAERLSIAYYSRNFLEAMFKDNSELAEIMAQYEERGRRPIITRHVRGHTNSIEEHLTNMEFDFLRERADDGESFIVVGRCGDVILDRYPNSISIFILADYFDKVSRVMRREKVEQRQAEEEIRYNDRARKRFHNAYSKRKWGDAGSYDICINSTRLGIDDTVDILVDYINRRIQ